MAVIRADEETFETARAIVGFSRTARIVEPTVAV
jgi:hypothetical protein